jgi:hypothetical protein
MKKETQACLQSKNMIHDFAFHEQALLRISSKKNTRLNISHHNKDRVVSYSVNKAAVSIKTFFL